jgi:pilus assembly protein FimV
MSLNGPATDIDMAGLAREFDLPGLPQGQEDKAPAGELKDPLFDLDAMDFSMPATPAPVLENPEPHLKDPLFDLDSMNFEPAASNLEPAAAHEPALHEAAPEQQGSALPHFDMSGIDLDLPPADETALPLPEVETVGAAPGEMSAAQMEMETKLDLAIAYQEIGDKEGARELLDEVIKGGSSEQVSKANAMRAKLA